MIFRRRRKPLEEGCGMRRQKIETRIEASKLSEGSRTHRGNKFPAHRARDEIEKPPAFKAGGLALRGGGNSSGVSDDSQRRFRMRQQKPGETGIFRRAERGMALRQFSAAEKTAARPSGGVAVFFSCRFILYRLSFSRDLRRSGRSSGWRDRGCPRSRMPSGHR